MPKQFKAIEEYIREIPEVRLDAFNQLIQTIRKNIPRGFEEEIKCDLLGWVVPLSIFPEGYHCDPKLPLPFINLANQKNFIALYHMGIYSDHKMLEWFKKEYPKHCKYKLDMGKSCIRFKKMDDIPYDLIGELIRKKSLKTWVDQYQRNLIKLQKRSKSVK